ncbi:hypothetical protein D3C83_270450 [compost metagenome]
MRRVLAAVAAGVTGLFAISMPYWSWYGFSTSFTLALAIELGVGSLLAALVMAAIVKPCEKCAA